MLTDSQKLKEPPSGPCREEQGGSIPIDAIVTAATGVKAPAIVTAATGVKAPAIVTAVTGVKAPGTRLEPE